jgi:CMP-N-acetylneuraminic acid synthetase
MYEDKSIIGLIPARGGSKRLPRKNIRPLLGKPLIVWTIEQALASEYLDRVIVSTDSEEIAEMSKKYGAEVPFMRPKELATDETKSVDVVLHALKYFEEIENYSPDIVVLLQPTSPLRTKEDIDKAIEIFYRNRCKSLISVYEAPNHYLWLFEVKGEFLKPLDCIYSKLNNNVLPYLYVPNGAIYIADVETIKKYKTFYIEKLSYYIMPYERSIDIDTELDLIVAETILGRKFNSGKVDY